MKTIDVINERLERYQGNGFRNHLGASVIGNPCVRQAWYIFRWATPSNIKARMLRLFDRGNREEIALVKFLRSAGIHVLDKDPKTGDQFRISDHNEHFGGSLDAIIFDPPEFPHTTVLGEFKTHNDKSYKQLKKEGLEKAKPTYWVQSHLYMHYKGLPACLHFNVNKNDDAIHVVEITYRDDVAAKYKARAKKVIDSPVPPPRPENASPAWYICRWCDYKDICHLGHPMHKNCRTCVNSAPVENGQWFCSLFNVTLTKLDQEKGCVHHTPIVAD